MAYDDSEARDDHGRWTDGGSSGGGLLGAHDRMDKLASNAQTKINESKPATYGTMRAGKKTVVVASKDGKSEFMTQHKTVREAESNAAHMQRHAAENHQFNMETRINRGQRAANYLRERAGRDAKYGKQLKFGF